MSSDLKSGPWWNYEVPMHWGSNSTFKTSNSKHPRKKLALWAKTTKFRCLVIWSWGPGVIMRSPTLLGSNSTFKTSNSKHPQKIWLFEPKHLNLDVWWFEIGAPVELWGPPHVGGPISPSKPSIQNTHQKSLFFETFVVERKKKNCSCLARTSDFDRPWCKNFQLWNLEFCTISMHIMLGTLCQILEVDDEWNILKCTLHWRRVQNISITIAILMKFIVDSLFHETKIPMVDMKV
jgi:hypothetical protein